MTNLLLNSNILVKGVAHVIIQVMNHKGNWLGKFYNVALNKDKVLPEWDSNLQPLD